MKDKGYTIIMLGRPGSGKGTQAARIAKTFGAKAFGTGEMLRRLAREKTFLGRKVAQLLASGKLVPSWLASYAWITELGRVKPADTIIFDGSPRTLGEAKLLEEVLRWYGRTRQRAFVIDISPSESLRRLRARRICVECRRPASPQFKKNTPQACRSCGGKLVRRGDDSPAVIRRRLSIFEHDVVPIVKYFRHKGILTIVDGSSREDIVFSDIKEVLARKRFI